jgi:hypothetical protein
LLATQGHWVPDRVAARRSGCRPGEVAATPGPGENARAFWGALQCGEFITTPPSGHPAVAMLCSVRNIEM